MMPGLYTEQIAKNITSMEADTGPVLLITLSTLPGAMETHGKHLLYGGRRQSFTEYEWLWRKNFEDILCRFPGISPFTIHTS